MAAQSNKKKFATAQQMALVFGIEPRTLVKWVTEFGMPREGRGEYDIVACVQWREQYNQKQIALLRAGGEDGLKAKSVYTISAARLKQYDLAERSGKLVQIDAVLPVFQKLWGIMTQRRKMFAKRTAPQLEGKETYGERELILTNSINELFSDIYSTGITELSRLGKLHHADEGIVRDNTAAPGKNRKRVGKRKPVAKPGDGK